MKRYSLAFLAAAAFSLAGCGGSVTTTLGNPGPDGSGITGNWQLALTSTGYGSTTYGIYLTQAGSAVSGIIGDQDAYPDCWSPPAPPCAFPFGTIDLVLSGTIDSAGKLTLNSNPAYEGGSFSITASTVRSTLIGTYSTTLVTTSPAGTWSDQGTISGTKIGTLSGTYKGTVTSAAGVSTSIATTLSQSASPNAYGFLEVSGSADFTGSSCFTSATILSSDLGAFIGNDIMFVNFVPANSPSTTIKLFGTLSADTKTLDVTYLWVTGGACDGEDLGTGTLTLQ
jgi:hypothetical protein